VQRARQQRGRDAALLVLCAQGQQPSVGSRGDRAGHGLSCCSPCCWCCDVSTLVCFVLFVLIFFCLLRLLSSGLLLCCQLTES
jgi:hypothetical protein